MPLQLGIRQRHSGVNEGSGFELRPITSGATLREPENADSLVELQSETPETK